MTNKKVAVLVNSCDAYEDVLKYFFYFVDVYWKDCPYNFYLNTESLSYNWIAPNGNSLTVINTGNVQWSKRLIRALNAVEEEYIIHILDDHFILENVNQNRIQKCVSAMEIDKRIGVFHFEEHLPNPYSIENNELGFREKNKCESFLASCHVALWRKQYLKKVLRKNENPWQFELYATERCRHYKEKIYALSDNSASLIHCYVKGKGGFGISGGKWAPNTVNLFKKHNLNCDFSVRGFYDVDKIYESWNLAVNPKLSFLNKIFLPFTDRKLFVEKVKPRILRFSSKIDIKGRMIDVFS